MKLIVGVFAFSFFLLSCGSSDLESNLAPARGQIGEIIMVIDSGKRGGQVDKEIRRTFLTPYPGLPQEESYFDLKYVDPRNLNRVLRNAKNLIFVATLDDNSPGGKILRKSFTPESIQRIQNDSNVFMHTKSNEFASGQEVIHFFARNDNILADNLIKNRGRILDYLNTIEKKRLLKSLYHSKELKGLSKSLLEDHKCYLRIPFGYELATIDQSFIWIRQISDYVDKTVFIFYDDYKSSDVFKSENILNFRNSITETFIRDIEVDSVHVTTQTVKHAPFITKEINFNNKYGVETRGLWKLSDNSRGGPFLSYTFVDEELNRIYYIEGYIDSPGKDKRDFIREIEAILSTFKTLSEYQSENSQTQS